MFVSARVATCMDVQHADKDEDSDNLCPMPGVRAARVRRVDVRHPRITHDLVQAQVDLQQMVIVDAPH